MNDSNIWTDEKITDGKIGTCTSLVENKTLDGALNTSGEYKNQHKTSNGLSMESSANRSRFIFTFIPPSPLLPQKKDYCVLIATTQIEE